MPRYAFLSLPLLLALLLAACGKKDDKPTGPPPATAVKVVAARQTAAVYYDELPGTVTALNRVELRAQVPGFITGIFFREGEVVPKGKVLYEIDARTYQAAVQQAQASVRSAEANAQNAAVTAGRYERLGQQDAVARQLIDNALTARATAQAQVAEARAALASAQTNLSYARITAPFTGRIGISQVRLGAQVGTTVLNTLAAEEPMGVDFVVSEQQLPRFARMKTGGRLAPGDSTFRLLLPDRSGYPQPGQLLALDQGVNAATGSVQVRLQFPNPDRVLKDGMSATVRVLNQASGTRVVVPAKAITEQLGETFVFVSDGDSVARQTRVQLGPRLADEVVVLDGLRPGQRVVAEGLGRLRDGGKINVTSPGAAAPAGGRR